ncbi:MAG: hypothetical protein AAF399_14215 [Bacteroidota bacterium]
MADQTQTALAQIHSLESDGLPMSHTTRQFEWIAKLTGALDFLFWFNYENSGALGI